jgi:hypothetical protein
MKTGLLLILLSYISLFANSKISLADRKKNYDARSNQILNLSDLAFNESMSGEIEKLKSTQIEIDSVYRSGDREKINSNLANAESNLSKIQKEFLSKVKTHSKELMEDYSFQLSSALEKEKMEKKKLTVDENTKREKSSAYMNIAKSDSANGIKFERDKNYFYSLQLFKRSIDYTKLAYKTNELKISDKFLEKSSSKETKEDEIKHSAKKAN